MSSSSTAPVRIGIDTGGTFTDFLVLDDRADSGIRVFKCPSTPAAPEKAILHGLAALGIDLQHCQIVHGSTVATNAVLERKGVPVVYIANRGLADVLTLGRQARAELYNLQPQPQPPPVPPALCLEVDQRTAADGSEVLPLDIAEVDRIIAEVRRLGVKSVAINLLFSYLNAAPEARLRDALQAADPTLSISLSSTVLPEQREYERGMATWLNASVAPLIASYLQRLVQAMNGATLNVMQSSARSIGAEVAAQRAVNLLLSGPAGGLLAARHLAPRENDDSIRLLTFDMGGTSTDVALIGQQIHLTSESRLAGYPVAVPMVDMHTIGAGGGSIARIDPAGMLQVGPQSAGAMPGPACYGKGGTDPTVTDANLVLGRLPASSRLGGDLPLDLVAAHQALRPLAQHFDGDPVAAARAVITLANEHMAEALRVISIHKGEDPSDYTLMSFGGAGGLHVCALAEALGMRRAIAPIHAGVLSALGMLVAQPGRELSHGLNQKREQPLSTAEAEALYRQLEQQACRELASEGIATADLAFRRHADLRYRGQSHCLSLDWQGIEDTEASFHLAHEQRYGHRMAVSVEWVTLRLSAVGPSPQLRLPALASASDDARPREQVTVAGVDNPVPVYAREDLLAGHILQGPAIVAESVATTFIDRGWCGRVDAIGNILLNAV